MRDQLTPGQHGQATDAGCAPPLPADRRSPKAGSPIKRVWARLSDSQRMINFDDASLAGEMPDSAAAFSCCMQAHEDPVS